MKNGGEIKRQKTYWVLLGALLIILVAIVSFAQINEPTEDRLDIRDVEGIPVLWEHGMPYFTRFLTTDHPGLDLIGAWKFQLDPEDRGVRERWLDACDREGILLLEEIPLYQAGWGVKSLSATTKNRLYTEAARQLIEMIERDRNHPSIVMWSIGNECLTPYPSIRQLYKRLYSMSKRFDHGRPVTFAIFIAPYPLSPTLDISAGIADVISVNEYYGWYFNEPEQVGGLLDAVHRKWPDKPVIVSEFGAGSVKGLSGGKLYPGGLGSRRDYSEAYQAHLYEAQFRYILKRPFVVGTIPWVFADFREEKMPNKPIPNMDLKGFVTYHREKKKAYDVVKTVYRGIKQKYGQ